MAVPLPSTPTILSTPFVNRTTIHLPLRPHSHAFSFSTKRFLRGSLSVTRFEFQPGFLPEPEDTEFVIKELCSRTEGFLYTIADAAVSSSDTVVTTTTKQNNDWFLLITNYVKTVLKVLEFGLSTLHVPHAYGFAIIMLAVLVRAALYPLRKKEGEYYMKMQFLEPQVRDIQKKYVFQGIIDIETSQLYESANIDGLEGWLPDLLSILVWIGLYRAFSMADGGPLSEGFFWIPSLSGPTTIAALQNGSGISWLFPFVDGHPPLGWPDTLAYLVLPVLYGVPQYISLQIIQSSQDTDPNVKSSQDDFPVNIEDFDLDVEEYNVRNVNIEDFDLDVEKYNVRDEVNTLVFGFLTLLVPSGLGLYWFTNEILNTLQKIWLPKLKGAKNPSGHAPNDNVKNDPMQKIQKSISKINSTKVGETRVDKFTADDVTKD